MKRAERRTETRQNRIKIPPCEFDNTIAPPKNISSDNRQQQTITRHAAPDNQTQHQTKRHFYQESEMVVVDELRIANAGPEGW